MGISNEGTWVLLTGRYHLHQVLNERGARFIRSGCVSIELSGVRSTRFSALIWRQIAYYEPAKFSATPPLGQAAIQGCSMLNALTATARR
jgi:hypothetical protein